MLRPQGKWDLEDPSTWIDPEAALLGKPISNEVLSKMVAYHQTPSYQGSSQLLREDPLPQLPTKQEREGHDRREEIHNMMQVRRAGPWAGAAPR